MMVLKYKEEGKIYLESTGHDYKKFREKFTEKVRVHAYLRLEYEHEGKKKVKFVFLSWVGKHMSAEHKERMHGHRHVVKEILKEHTCEIHFHEEVLMTEAKFYEHLKKEGHADHWEK